MLMTTNNDNKQEFTNGEKVDENKEEDQEHSHTP
jgi:hypothetical protein